MYPGIGEYRIVKTENKEIIKSSNMYYDTTNNLMEFFALIEALMLIKEKKLNKIVYSDSVTAIAWVKNKKIKTTLKENFRNVDTFFSIFKYIKWLEKNDISDIKILKWDTKTLGEIPADFGRK